MNSGIFTRLDAFSPGKGMRIKPAGAGSSSCFPRLSVTKRWNQNQF